MKRIWKNNPEYIEKWLFSDIYCKFLKPIEFIFLYPPSHSPIRKAPIPIFLALLALISLSSCSPGKTPPKAVKGVLDLQDWDFGSPPSHSMDIATEGDGSLRLDGEWEFYWKTLPEETNPGVWELPEGSNDFLKVPSNWNGNIVRHETKEGMIEEEKIEGDGYGTYRLKIIMQEVVPLTFRIPNQGTSYKFIANNELLWEEGKVGTTLETSTPGRATRYTTMIPESKEVVLLLSISNFHNSGGGFWQSIEMGNSSSMYDNNLKYVALDLFVVGILSIMGVYHISLFLLRRQDFSTLYFGIFCILLTLRSLLTGEKYLHTIFPNLEYSLSIGLEYLTIYLGLPIFYEYVYSLYPQDVNKTYKNFLYLFSLLFIGSIIIFKPRLYTNYLTIYQLIIFITIVYSIFVFQIAISRKREGAKTISIGFLLFGFTIINDILFSNNFIIINALLSSYGLVIFIFSQSYFLTSRFANAFKQVTDLSENLEKKVEERTKVLQEMTKTLETTNEEILNSQKDTENLNELIKNINSVSSLTDVMMYVMFYLEMNYNYNTFWLLLLDKETSNLKTIFCISNTLGEESTTFLHEYSQSPEPNSSIGKTFSGQSLMLST